MNSRLHRSSRRRISAHKRLFAIELLESRQLLATNIGVVRPDISHANDLLQFLLDTETLQGTRNDNSEIQAHFGLSSSSLGSSGANDLAFAGDWGNLGYDMGGVARNNVGLGAKQFFLDTDRDADAEYAFRFGLPGDGVVAGNFDGSNGDDVGVTRNDNGFKHWFVTYAAADPTNSFPRNDSTVGVNANFVFGFDSDFARVGDFNADGIDDAVVVRNVSGNLTWYVSHGPFPNDGSTANVHETFTYGINGYIPVVGDWNNNGDDNMGVVLNNNGAAEWYLDTNDVGPYEIFLSYGSFTDQFIVGQWPDRVWDNEAGNSNWSDANNWSGNALPVSTSKILIDQPNASNVFFDSGIHTVGSIFSNEPISVTGGALIVANTSDLAAVGVNGGELVVRAPLNANAFSMSAGGLYLETSSPLGGLGLQLSGGSVLVTAGSQSLSNDINISNTVSFGGAGSLSLQGTIVGSGTFQKTGSNFVQVLGANTYTGSTAIAAGELLLGSSNRLPDTPISIASGAVLNLAGFNENVGTLSGAGNVLLGSGAATFRTTSSITSTYSGAISGNGVFNKAGIGSLTLANSNTYVGDTHIEGGQLIIGAADALPDSTTVDVQSGTTFNVNGFNERVGAIGGAGVIELGVGQLKTNHTLSSSFFGSINGTGTVVKDGTASLALYGASTFTGGLSIQGGTVQLQNSNLLADTLDVTVQSGSVFDLNNRNESVRNVTGAGSVTLGTGTLTTSVTGNPTLTTSITGSGGLTKTGSGTLTIDSNKSYTGNTLVAAGTLIVNANLSSTSSVSVFNGASLRGTGTVSATNVAGTLAPGNSPGVLFTNNLSLAAGSHLEMEIGGTTPGNNSNNHDQVVVTGTVNIAATASLVNLPFNGFVPVVGNTFTLISNDGSDPIVGTFSGLPQGAVIPNFLGSTNAAVVSYVGGDGNDFEVAVVSQPPVLSSIEGTTLSYTENAAPTAVTSTLVVSDVDNANMVSATVSFTAGFATGQDLLSATTSATNITANYNGATGVLTLSGSDTKANYQTVLRSVTYENTSENPSTTLRTLSFQVSDGALSSNVATRDISITAVNDAPVQSGIEGTTLSYTENAAPTAVTSTLVVSDVDNANMVSASVSFTAGFATGQDLLSATTAATNITANYNGATGVLTLSGSDTKANYQTVLRSVTYENTSENPSTTLRTLSFQVSDGALSSNVATRDIALTAVNDAPVLSGIEGTTLSYTENAAPTAVTSTLVVSDVDNANMVSATVSFTAGFATGQDLLSATTSATNITANYNSATGVLTLLWIRHQGQLSIRSAKRDLRKHQREPQHDVAHP